MPLASWQALLFTCSPAPRRLLMQSLGVSSGGDAAAAAPWGAPGTAPDSSGLLHPQHEQPSSFPPLMEQPFGGGQPQQAAMQHAQQQLPEAAAGPGQGELTFTGLQNEAGEYNCFLNVIIQCLWRCTDFRQLVGGGGGWEGGQARAGDLFVLLHRLQQCCRARLGQCTAIELACVSNAAWQAICAPPTHPTSCLPCAPP